MVLLDAGWFQTTWFPSQWWQDQWWLEYGTAAPPSTPTSGGVGHYRRIPPAQVKPKLNPRIIELFIMYLRLKLED